MFRISNHLLLLPRDQFCMSRGEASLGHARKKVCLPKIMTPACLNTCLAKATLGPSRRPLTPMHQEKNCYSVRVWSKFRDP